MAIEDAENLLNALPRFSPWPARLLGVETFRRSARTSAENQREYNDEKWKQALSDYLATSEKRTCYALTEQELSDTSAVVCFRNGGLERITAGEAFDTHISLLAECIGPLLPASALVDLGAGTGRILFALASRLDTHRTELIATEFTDNGRRLISAVAHQSGLSVRVLGCDFTAPSIISGAIPANAVLFSSMATVCVPRLRQRFMNALLSLRPRAIVYYEPIPQHCPTLTTLGLMQHSYIRMNRYNTDLLPLIHQQAQHKRVTVLSERPQVFGVNPLLVGSLLVLQVN
jgi:hypothetical protein